MTGFVLQGQISELKILEAQDSSCENYFEIGHCVTMEIWWRSPPP